MSPTAPGPASPETAGPPLYGLDPADIPTHGKFDAPEFDVLLFEFKADINKYLASLAPGDHPRTLKDLIAFNERNREREMPYFGQEIFTKAEAKGPLVLEQPPVRRQLELQWHVRDHEQLVDLRRERLESRREVGARAVRDDDAGDAHSSSR